MMAEFDMMDLGLLHYFFELQIIQNDHGIFISQEKYTCDLLKKFYISIVGGLMYLTHTRLNILFSIDIISRFTYSLYVHHLGATKRILQYVHSTINYGILYQHDTEFNFSSYSDSDFVFNFGSGAISWIYKK
ncbi:unnamed protein product [Spirodela intermedia]|uniref:Uncharacterized protein n=1 Tax=Spirodela intermedia TaxID=51605 RepID=A0A7I8KX68_SPIIN|nr:unnamed protein product [Spirodela intermedia]